MASAAPPLTTPVAFFVFNRPDTAEQVFAAIRAARPTRLLVVADGPRPDRPDEAERCRQARALVDRVDWDCEVTTNFSEVNLGCKKRLSSGISWVFEQVEAAIILEDDCLPHPSFFPFCQAMLERYRDDERVMMIGGTNYLLDELDVEESYVFSRYFAIWGWATWRRAWRLYDIEMSEWPALKASDALALWYPEGYMRAHIGHMFDEGHAGRINTWDIQWFYTCLFNSGLSIVPRVNMISNLGAIGTHTSGDTSNNYFPLFALDAADLRHPRRVFPSSAYDPVFFRRKFRPTLRRKAAASVLRLVRR